MANIYSLKSGVASDTTVWSGGVVPVSGDRVLICTGHTVTVDGTYTWGDDSTSTITINSVSTTASIWVAGTLKASRTANSQLTCNGDLRTAASTTATIDYGRTLIGSGVEDPIPIAYTAKIILNKSASLATGKYGLYVDNGASFFCAGAAKNPNSTLVSTANSGQATITVDQVDGWQVGDLVVITTTSASNLNQTEEKIIQSINTSGANPVVTFTTNLAYLHLARGIAGNLTSNVVFTSHSPLSHPGYNAHFWTYTQPVNTREYCFSRFAGIGNYSLGSYKDSCLSLMANSTTLAFLVNPRIKGCMFDGASGGGTLPNGVFLGSWRQGYTVDDCAAYVYNGNNCAAFLSSIRVTLNRCQSYRGAYGARAPGGATAIFNDCKFHGSYSTAVGSWSGSYFEVNNCHLDASARAYVHIVAGTVIFNDCDLGTLAGFPAATDSITPSGYSSQVDLEFKNCQIHSSFVINTYGAATVRLQDCTPDTIYKITNKNEDVTLHEWYTPGGSIVRDNAVSNRSRTSFKAAPWNTAVTGPVTFTIETPAPDGIEVIIVGYLRKNSSYGASTLPNVVITGPAHTGTDSFTMTSSVDTWEIFTLAVTNTSGIDGTYTLTFSGQTSNSGGVCYLDGVVTAPFVTWARHYGYTYNPSSITQTVDPVVQLTEAQAAALTGISYAAGTLTVSSAHTIREIYDWMQWYECSNRLEPIMTSSDGISFALAADFDLSAALTGTGSLSMPSNTLTFTGSSTVSITHDSGVMTTIAVAGLVAGSRIQLVDMSGPTELYNDVPGTSLTINSNWTTDKTIRLRVGYAVGAVAKLPIETSGILSSTGASFLVSQVADTTYNTLAIDGSTCTEFAPDYPNLQIDVSDGDGTTSVQRLYAWSAWAQTSSQGIDLMFQAVQATDTSNFVIDVDVVDAKLDNVTGSPVIVAGGYLARSDGTTVIAAASGSIQMDPGKAYVANDISTRVLDIAKIHGLVQGTPLVVTPTSRVAGDITQTISGDGVAISTVSRV